MTSAASKLREQFFAGGNGIEVAGFAGKPRGVVRRILNGNPTAHYGVVGAAILRAKEMILANFGGPEPQRVVTPGYNVHFRAEGGHVEIVDDIFAAHDELDVPIDRNMQLINFLAAVGLLQSPHPLLADDIDVQGVSGRSAEIDIDERAPGKNDHGDRGGDQGPADFQEQIAMHVVANFTRSLAAVLVHREDAKCRHQHDEKETGQNDEEKQRVDIAGETGRLLGKKWKR